MSKSTPRRGFGKRSGTVTVIEAKVHRSSARNARMAFIITTIVTCLIAMTVASDHMHPILAFLLGAVIGLVLGAIVWTLVRIWPVIRVIWWWTPEISLAVLLTYGWVQLATSTPALVTLAVLAVVVGVPAAVPYIRRHVVAVVWCMVVRHRLRVCFSQFIIANQSGSLPLILWARPTPVGERVWVHLRPGLSMPDLVGRLDKIAVTCLASSVMIERASEGNAAYLRFDIKRREVLTATVGSPLPDLIDPDFEPLPREPMTVPLDLDLPDVPADPKPKAPATRPAASSNGKKPAASSATQADAGDDIDDWI
ncbi:hypothetical protein [Winogradskya humida]|uniref:Uncharacterized protein n=1 Tax=Winogradskya humida TaxID=113566 RepID=A0ABQ3ZU71_9ACTN|nr:hypothetical protein [Actinoplanes humidus]GIE22129.1 hypothetical protein Ahu01nite_052310 [Actinoplanes humidus]